LAAALRHGLGVQPEDRVALLGYNHPDTIAFVFACARLGAILVPLNWRLALPEHRSLLADCAPKVILVAHEFAEHVEPMRDDIRGPTFVLLRGECDGWLCLQALLEEQRRVDSTDVNGEYTSPLLICYTSGATGKPKGAVLTQNAVFWNAVNSTHMHDLTSEAHILTTLPLFHVGGMNIQTLPALHAGATVTLHARFDPAATLTALGSGQITLTVLVPTQMKALAKHPLWQETSLDSLRAVTTGSTTVSASVIEPFHSRDVPVIQVYGSTETAPIALFLSREASRRKVGSTGKSALHCEVRLVDTSGRDVTNGAPGEILVRGPNVMSHYWNAPQSTAEALRDGWFHTGDIGHRDAEGFFYVDDRKKDVIISGSENIYPAELENILAECGMITEAAVVGRADESWGEVTVAVVVSEVGSGLTKGKVLDLLQNRVARYKLPRDVIFVDKLPRNAMGKIDKEALRALVGSHAARF
jgi:fatty-acyl-CoA synthase